MQHTLSVLFAIAVKELLDHLRNGWIVAVALAFALFAALITFAGLGFSGSVGIAEEQNTLLSLVSLALYLVPLLGLLLGYDAISGEQERGTLDLLRSYPFNSAWLIYGKSFGLSSVLFLTLLIGMILPAIFSIVNGHALSSWLILWLMSIWLGVIFVFLAVLLSVVILEKGRLIAAVIFIWLLLVVLFDMGLIGLLVYTEGDLPGWLVTTLFYFNPASLYRLVTIELLLSGEALQQLGLAGHLPSLANMFVSLLLWTFLPIVVAGYKIRKIG